MQSTVYITFTDRLLFIYSGKSTLGAVIDQLIENKNVEDLTNECKERACKDTAVNEDDELIEEQNEITVDR